MIGIIGCPISRRGSYTIVELAELARSSISMESWDFGTSLEVGTTDSAEDRATNKLLVCAGNLAVD
jgi:hypothetical protein